MKKYILCMVLLLQTCVSTRVEDIEFITRKKISYFPYGSTDAISFMEFIKRLDLQPRTYTASFKMDIQSFHPEKKTFAAKGKIFFNAEHNKIRIQLMDRFFGMIFTQIIAGRDGIQIKSAGQKEIHSQPMDDITIIDPTTSARIVIPFRVIFDFLTRDYLRTVTARGNYYNFQEKKILVAGAGEKLIYLFDTDGPLSIELNSEARKIRAIATVTKGGKFLPSEITTKVTDFSDAPRDKDLVRITLGNLETDKKIPEETFRF